MTTIDETPADVSDVVAELDAALTAILDAEWTAPEDHLTPDELAGLGMEEVNEYGRRRAAIERRRMRIKAEHARRVAPLLEIIRRTHEEIALHDAWSAALDKPLARSADWVEATLIARALLIREKTADLGPKQVKTLRTPHVVVSTKEHGGGLVVTDEEKALAWASSHHPELVKRELRRGDAGKMLTQTKDGVVDTTTGDIVEGVEIDRPKVTATVKLTAGCISDVK